MEIGSKYGKWEILSLNKLVKGGLSWNCKCKCGLIKSVSGASLRNGKSTSCRKCSEHKHKNKLAPGVWSRIRSGARQRDLLIELGTSPEESKKFLYDLLNIQQESKCALSGLPIFLANTSNDDKHGVSTASLDRINSELGYVKNNVQWVHKHINKMKWDMNEEQFINYCIAIAKCHTDRYLEQGGDPQLLETL
jgi:hypothetical protein